jgi:hypothetical protein
MRRSVMAGAVLTAGTVLGVLTPVAGSTAAWAGGPQHVKSTSSGEMTFPAGTICDFNYNNAFTASDNAVIFPDKTIDYIDLSVTHTNLDTGYTLTEVDHYSETVTAGQTKDVGVVWHLRNPDGKLVVVQGGQLVFSAAGDVVKFTPAINPDFAAVICPALGGHPAS